MVTRRNKLIGAAVLAFVVLGIIVFWAVGLSSKAGPANVAVTVVGRTNDPAGRTIVSAVVSNSGPVSITIDNYFFMCPHDQTWDVARLRRLVLGRGRAATVQIPKERGDCTLLVLYTKHNWKGTVRYWTGHVGLWRLFPKSKWGLPEKYDNAAIAVGDEASLAK
jgi:hypothetical protein